MGWEKKEDEFREREIQRETRVNLERIHASPPLRKRVQEFSVCLLAYADVAAAWSLSYGSLTGLVGEGEDDRA